jgi:hypothetical protein
MKIRFKSFNLDPRIRIRILMKYLYFECLNAYLLDGNLQRNKDSIVIISKTVILGINVLK